MLATLLLLAILALAGLYLAAIGPYWNITPDSATYVGNARSLAAGRGIEHVGPHPPVTSVVFAPVMALFPDSYGPLNALTTVLFLLAFFLAYRLIAPRAGRLHGLVVVLLSLGFVRVFEESTNLLSEPVFACLTFLFLVLAERSPAAAPPGTVRSDSAGWGRQLVAGVVLVLVGLTRTVGLTLILAVLAHELSTFSRRGPRPRSPRPLLLTLALLAALAMLGWKAWVAGHGGTAWEVEYQPLDSGSPTTRIVENAPSVLAVGGVLMNAWDPARGAMLLTLHAAATLVFLGGLLLTLRDRLSVTSLYVGLYVSVITVHVLVGGYSPFRHLVPVAPLLFHYALLGARAADDRLTASFGAGAARVLQGAGVLYLAGYLVVGVGGITQRLPEEHRSAFGEYPIKWAGSPDAQRLALWLKDHAAPDQRFASLQPDMWEVVSERRGADLVVASPEPPRFLSWLRQNQIRYVMVDQALPFAERTVGPAVAAYPDRFQVVVRLPGAILYEFRTEERADPR